MMREGEFRSQALVSYRKPSTAEMMASRLLSIWFSLHTISRMKKKTLRAVDV